VPDLLPENNLLLMVPSYSINLVRCLHMGEK
jgi:hypothetical protein